MFNNYEIFIFLLSVFCAGVALFVGFFVSYVLFGENYIFMSLIILGFLGTFLLRVFILHELGYPKDGNDDFK